MERWAANTLRTLGIILTAGFILISSLFFLLLTLCAAGPSMGGSPGNSSQAAGFALVGILIAIAGGLFIAWLARAIYRSRSLPEEPGIQSLSTAVPAEGTLSPSPAEPRISLPLHLSPLGRKAVDRLVLALAAQIVLSAAAWIFNQLHFWAAPRIFAPFPSAGNWPLTLLLPFVLYHIPYAILIYVLSKRPDRRAFTYALAVPAVFLMQSLVSLGYVSLFSRHPVAFLLLVIPWAVHIVILVLAYKAIQQVGTHPQPSSLIIAAVVTWIFFSFIHALTPILYRFAPLR